MAAIGHPLLGDPTYGHSPRARPRSPLSQQLAWFHRQALHAWELGFVHPATGAWLDCRAPLPADLEQVLAILRREAKAAAPDVTSGILERNL
jgi:23S rRNA pseudouridine1911/1915/1917 synthase